MVAVKDKCLGRFLFDKLAAFNIIKCMKVRKSKVKVLSQNLSRKHPLHKEDVWYFYEDCGMEEIKPVFNRNGRYYCRFTDIAWEEHEGRAFLEKDSSSFKWRLFHEEIPELSDREMEALEICLGIKHLGITWNTRRIYIGNRHIRELKAIRRDTMMFRRRIIGK